MREVRLELLRPDEIEQDRKNSGILYLPLGPLEWHGPHIPYGFDALNAYNMAIELAKRMGGLVLPCLYLGAASIVSKKKLTDIGFNQNDYIVGRDYPGNFSSFYFHPETVGIVLRDYLQIINDKKYKAVILINTHGEKAHNDVIERLAKEYNNTSELNVLPLRAMSSDFEKYPFFYNSDDEELAKKYAGQPGHAGKVETSLAMYYYPERVDLSTLPPMGEKLFNTKWAITDTQTTHGNPTKDFSVREEEDPRFSSEQIGKELFELAIQQKIKEIQHFFGVIQKKIFITL